MPEALSLTRKVLRTLKGLNWLYGASLLAFLIITFANRDFVMEAFKIKPAEGIERIFLGIRLIMVIGVATIPINFAILNRLIAMVDTVRGGDPFVVANADRLKVLAWCVLTLELLHILVGVIASASGSQAQPLDIDLEFGLTPWIAVLLLFVLAKVFEHGARMRSDLEGTV